MIGDKNFKMTTDQGPMVVLRIVFKDEKVFARTIGAQAARLIISSFLEGKKTFGELAPSDGDPGSGPWACDSGEVRWLDVVTVDQFKESQQQQNVVRQPVWGGKPGPGSSGVNW